MNHKGFAPIFILALAAIFIVAGGIGWYFAAHKTATPGVVACTQEAKQCPDGTYVSRTGPDCAFAACPASGAATSTATTSTVPAVDGSNLKTYVNPELGISFSYLVPLGVPVTITTDSEGLIYYHVSEGTGTQAYTGPAFTITILGNNTTSSLSDWFNKNEDPSTLLLENNTYTLTNLNNGGIMLLLTGGVPTGWKGGELSDAYMMSPDRTHIAIVDVSQDDPLYDYGVSTDKISRIINSILSTFQFASSTSAEGKFCGGIATGAFPCPAGYSCKLDGTYPDAGGHCVQN